jgi:hypothetical protein
VNSHPHPDLTRLHASRTWWPSAASCAFVASGLEIVSFGLGLYVRAWALSAAAAREQAILPSSLSYLGFTIAVIGVAAQARALWAVGRRQRAVAPVSAHLGQWAVATYVVVSGLLFVMLTVGAFGVWPVGNWVFRGAEITLTLAFGCLGWASRGGGDSGPRQRWASGGLPALTMFGVFSLIRILFGLPTGQRWLWLKSLHAGLRAGTWAAVGAWQRD